MPGIRTLQPGPERSNQTANNSCKGVNDNMPQVTIRTTVYGHEETLSEYLCDWTDCPNVAVELLGVVRELGLPAMVCAEHAALLARRGNDPD